jgi:hypothetical protein
MLMIVPFFGLVTLWATFYKIWAIFFQSSGHPDPGQNLAFLTYLDQYQ